MDEVAEDDEVIVIPIESAKATPANSMEDGGKDEESEEEESSEEEDGSEEK
jgi:hypothetical protein